MKKIANQFFANYVLMFIISLILAFFAFLLLDFADHVISDTLVNNNYTAESLMEDDHTRIDPAPVIKNGGGVQVINRDYEVVFSAGINTFRKDKLSTQEFTDFLMAAKSKGIPYSYSIKYHEQGQFWLVVTFPTSIRIDFAVVHNHDYESVDKQKVAGVLLALVLFYLLLLAISTVIYSKISSLGIVSPLRKLSKSARRLKEGDYAARVDLNLKNEFAELQDTFNAMAEQVEREISLRKQSEENRKQLVLDISHDLKNPLASIVGYAEVCLNKPDLTPREKDAYLKIIYDNGVRANKLISGLFELSKMDSSDFLLKKTRIDICEYLREEMGKALPVLDNAGFIYDFAIPEREIFVMLDPEQMARVFQNLVANSVQYNSSGTVVMVQLWEEDSEVIIIFKDNGIGISEEIAEMIFKPFVRADLARNSGTGGTGLGLAIVEKIIAAHGGSIKLKTGINRGCEFIIRLPKI